MLIPTHLVHRPFSHTTPTIHYLAFNQDKSLFSCGLSNGFKVFGTDAAGMKVDRSNHIFRGVS